MAKPIDLIEKFIEESRRLGYEISGSIFKADFNGKSWTIGFWVRAGYPNPQELIGRIGRAKDPDFKEAVKKAIKNALYFEQHGVHEK